MKATACAPIAVHISISALLQDLKSLHVFYGHCHLQRCCLSMLLQVALIWVLFLTSHYLTAVSEKLLLLFYDSVIEWYSYS